MGSPGGVVVVNVAARLDFRCLAELLPPPTKTLEIVLGTHQMSSGARYSQTRSTTSSGTSSTIFASLLWNEIVVVGDCVSAGG